MFVRKWFAIIGIEFMRDPATLDCLFERLMKSIAVGCQVIGAVSNEARMIIQDQAEVGREDFALDVKFWPGRKIRHPQVIDEGRLEGLGWSALQPSPPQ